MTTTASSHSRSYYDVCIVGAGPAALSCLSAIRETFSLDHLSESQFHRAVQSQHHSPPLSVCVIDPASEWLHEWKENFQQLRIQYLRSPAMAHPDTFDSKALLAYAYMQGQQHQQHPDALVESGCADLRKLIGLGETQIGLWKLPSNALFLEFCQHLVERLSHDRVQGHVVDIVAVPNTNEEEKLYDVLYFTQTGPNGSNGAGGMQQKIRCKSIILATGTSGKVVIPPGLDHCPTLYSWKDPEAYPLQRTLRKKNHPHSPKRERVLIVGGGLTAVQAALRVVQDGHSCTLCSRRDLQEKHFDIPVEWFDRRMTHGKLSHIYHESVENRLAKLKEARDGGSVPPIYMKQLADYKETLVRWVGDIEYEALPLSNEKVGIRFKDVLYEFDRVILACGVQPDLRQHPLLSKFLERWPIPNHGGFPVLSQDIQWDEINHPNIFVVGAMAALQVGPDAGNLMGIRRAATLVANALNCRSWLRQKAIISNPFDALFHDDSDTESESSSCSTCESELS